MDADSRHFTTVGCPSVGRQRFILPPPTYPEIYTIEAGDRFIFRAETGPCDHPAVILSMPKAGTYLIAKILETLGLVDLEVHLWETGFSDYRGKSNAEKLDRAREFTRDIPLRASAQMILPGQFAVGHIVCTPEARRQFENFARIACVRDVRHALVSFMRFEHRRLLADPLRSPDRRQWALLPDGPERMRAFLAAEGAGLLWLARGIFEWTKADCVLCRFEDLLGDNGDEAQLAALARIASAVSVDVAGRQVLDKVLGAETLTYSGRRSTLEPVWDESVERDFCDLDGPAVNELLGYTARP